MNAKNQQFFKVYIDGTLTEISNNDFKKYNVVVNKGNGYSHSYLAIEKFDANKHFYSSRCPFTNRILQYVPTHLTTSNITNKIIRSSEVTNS